MTNQELAWQLGQLAERFVVRPPPPRWTQPEWDAAVTTLRAAEKALLKAGRGDWHA